MGEFPGGWTVLLVGGLLLASLAVGKGLHRVGIPPLVGYLLLGLLVRVGDRHLGLLARDNGEDILQFLAMLGVIALLFRVGLESDVWGMVRQLRGALPIWIGNVAVSGVLGWVAARHVLGAEPIPSLVVATALTATSVGITAPLWRQAGALESAEGETFLDVAELDDLSGVVLMALLLMVLPLLAAQEGGSVGSEIVRALPGFLLRLAGFAAVCLLFARWVEHRLTRWAAEHALLLITAIAFVLAASAELLGFSAAIGAFFAGLAFSRDPERVRLDTSFGALEELFGPFFFLGIGASIPPAAIPAGLATGGVLLVAAVAGKVLGTVPPALPALGWTGALVLGVSMVPRAEIMMLVAHRVEAFGAWALPESLYAGLLVVSIATCLGAPPVLNRMLRRRS